VNDDLKVTITITGKRRSEKCSVDVDFDPETAEGVYDGSGVEILSSQLLEAMKHIMAGAGR
jgi:hypothetical protein